MVISPYMRGFVPFPAHIRALLVLLYVINKKERSNETRFKDRTQSLCVLSKAQTITAQNAKNNPAQRESVIVYCSGASRNLWSATDDLSRIQLFGVIKWQC